MAARAWRSRRSGWSGGSADSAPRRAILDHPLSTATSLSLPLAQIRADVRPIPTMSASISLRLSATWVAGVGSPQPPQDKSGAVFSVQKRAAALSTGENEEILQEHAQSRNLQTGRRYLSTFQYFLRTPSHSWPRSGNATSSHSTS